MKRVGDNARAARDGGPCDKDDEALMTDLPSVPPISEKDLVFLKEVDSPTISNAIEPFKVRDRTEGFIGGEVERSSRRCRRWSGSPSP